jgi:hypothetical protein
VERAVNLESLNALANQSEVLCAIAPGQLAVNLAWVFGDPRNVVRGDVDGAVLFLAQGDGLYEVHYLFTNKLRGKAAVERLREAADFMFAQVGARAICGQTPCDNKAARFVNRVLGGQPFGTTVDNSGRLCVMYVLQKSTWAMGVH